jgi:predicted metal-binding membrane protein
VEHVSASGETSRELWLKRESLLPGTVLVVLAAAGWTYTVYQASAPGSMEMDTMPGVFPFLSGWAAMMVAMMLPATLPLILLYRVVAHRRLDPAQARTGMVSLLVGYIAVWSVAGLPVYAYNLVAEAAGPTVAALPGLLLMAGGAYQFTALKGGCHARCSNPLFFLMNKWRPGAIGALRMGALHGIDCLGCCLGLMAGLVALGMMNLTLMFSVALVIFAEKTLPNGHRIARLLGVLMVVGGVVFLGFSLLGGLDPGLEVGPAIETDPKMEMNPGMESM